jgi:outer membrane protein OmpU
MNKLKKIGLSALAGSLAAVSANAGELTVSGSSNITFTNESYDTTTATSTGNPFGTDSNLVFSGSGDVNGMTASFYAAIQAGGGSYASNQVSLDMGDMGAITFDQGVGGNGADSIDNVLPTAWEEADDGLAGGGNMGATAFTGSTNVFKYTNTVAGFGVNAAYDTELQDADTTEGATSAVAGTATAPRGSNYSVAITNNTLVDGLDVGVGYGKNDIKDGASDTNDQVSMTGYAKYTMGPAVIGYQRTESTGGKAGALAAQADGYGIAFNVNENLSISYQTYEIDHLATSGGTDFNTEFDAIGAAYTMGAAKVTLNSSEQSGNATSAAYNEERTEIALSLNF